MPTSGLTEPFVGIISFWSQYHGRSDVIRTRDLSIPNAAPYQLGHTPIPQYIIQQKKGFVKGVNIKFREKRLDARNLASSPQLFHFNLICGIFERIKHHIVK